MADFPSLFCHRPPPQPSPVCGKGGRSYIRSPNLDAPSLAAAGEGWGGGRWQKSEGDDSAREIARKHNATRKSDISQIQELLGSPHAVDKMLITYFASRAGLSHARDMLS